MYYEIATIRQYKDSKGTPYFQVRLKKDSKLTDVNMKVKDIALVNVDEIKEIVDNSDVNKYNELQAKYNNTSEEIVEVKQELQQYKATVESLTSEVEKLKAEKVQLQEDLLTEKTNSKKYVDEANSIVIDVKDKIVNLQEEHKEELAVKDSEIAELNYKLNNEKDLTKELLIVRSDFLKQGYFKRFLKVEPESSKRIAKLKELPEDIETNIS